MTVYYISDSDMPLIKRAVGHALRTASLVNVPEAEVARLRDLHDRLPTAAAPSRAPQYSAETVKQFVEHAKALCKVDLQFVLDHLFDCSESTLEGCTLVGPWARANAAYYLVEEMYQRAQAKVQELWTQARAADAALSTEPEAGSVGGGR